VEQMTPMEALERYLQSRQVPKQRMDRLMQYAQLVVSSEVLADSE
jgi:hypothetical protein